MHETGAHTIYIMLNLTLKPSWSDLELMHPPYMSNYLITHSNSHYFEPHTFISCDDP